AGGRAMATAVVAHELDPVPLPSARRVVGALPLAALILALLLAGTVAAVSHATGRVTPLDAVRAASSRTLEAHTARLSLSMKSASGPLAKGVTEDGAVDFANKKGSLQVDPSALGVPGFTQKIEAVFDFAATGAVVYMHIPQLARETGG